MPASPSVPKVFFPWERRRGMRSLLARAGARPALFAILSVSSFFLLASRERYASEVRATRGSITTAIRGIAAFRADHEAACPRSLGELVAGRYVRELPADAWGRPLRVLCPGRKDPRGFDVSSDGPDGEPGGLDRVE